MTSYSENVNFFGIEDESVIYDERKKRFVYTKDIPGALHREYFGSNFKSERPDLTGQEQIDFKWKLRFGQQMLRYMNY